MHVTTGPTAVAVRAGLRCPALAALLTAPQQPARAQGAAPASPPPPPRLEASAQLTFLDTRGNATAQALGAGGDVTWRPAAWTYAAKATFAQTEANDSLQARSVAALLRGAHGIGGRLSAYGQYGFLRDRFAGVQQRHVLESGLSYAAIARPRQALRLDAGLGYLDEQRPTDRLQGATLTLGAPYRLGVTGTTQFTFEPRYLLPLTATDEWKYGQDVALTVAVNTILALKVAHTLRYAATPPPSFRKTDAIMTVSLVAKMRRPR